MYRVKNEEGDRTRYFEEQSQHRSDLFKRPDERAALIERLDGDREAIDSLKEQLEEEQEEEQSEEDALR